MNKHKVASILTMLATLNGVSVPMDPLIGVDLAQEYELIKQKKSKLSSNLRRQIVSRMQK